MPEIPDLTQSYYKAPWNPKAGAQEDIQRGLQDVAAMPMQNAQLQAQQQANTDAAYNSPARPATATEGAIGDHIVALMRNTPGHTPEHEAALTAELSQLQSGDKPSQPLPPGQAYGPATPQGQGPAPVGPPTGPSGLQQSAQNGPGYAMQPPQVSATNGMGAAGPWATNQDQTGMGRPQLPLPQVPQVVAPGASRPSVASSAPSLQPYSRGDVHTLMQAAPLFKDKDEEKRREFDAMMDYRNRALAAKEKLGKLAADAKLATNDNDRKRALELLKIETMREIAGVQAQARMGSSLYGIVDQNNTQAIIQYIGSFLADAESGVQQVTKSPPLQAVQQPHHVTPNTAPRDIKPRVNGTGTQFEKGKTYDVPDAPWGPKSKYMGKDAQGHDHWVAP